MRAIIWLAAAFALFSAPALGQDLVLEAERAQIVRLPGPAATVVIGNPAVADAVIHDRSTLIFTGKTYGRTNIIALDSRGRVIFARDVVVGPAQRGRLTLYRGPERQTLACAPECQPAPAIGDSDDSFARITAQQAERIAIGEAAADAANAAVAGPGLAGGR
ncbi:MAG: pilus assembly protein N-terminal domain-containing protein [Maricaulaceae bacterium]|nr:pilus assembly protein N-terminal domain-containing protein [Maricaulaceae bacterium]